jgi:hypothetical protein
MLEELTVALKVPQDPLDEVSGQLAHDNHVTLPKVKPNCRTLDIVPDIRQRRWRHEKTPSPLLIS